MNLTARTLEGQWVAATISDERITEEMANQWARDHAQTLGLPSLIPVIFEDVDPRTGELLDVEPEPRPAPPPDPNAFLLAALNGLGLVRGNQLLAAWPTFTVALNAGNWAVTRAIIDAATEAGSVTREERDALLALLDEHGIPEA